VKLYYANLREGVQSRPAGRRVMQQEGQLR
jgi:hypothetical protein